MQNQVVIVLDCGATNIRAIALDPLGRVVAKASEENFTVSPAAHSDWHHWPVTEIIDRLASCCRTVIKALGASGDVRIRAVTITSFGVDGTLVDPAGEILYPVISWKCPRTWAVMENIDKYLPVSALKRISGVGQYSFNTLYKLIWLRENHPELMRNAHAWLFMSSLIAWHLTGEMRTDRTMAGTSQLLEISSGEFSDEILRATGISKALFPPMIDPGESIGEVQAAVAARFGLPPGTPVISTGHDTQFALLGSGAEPGQPVLSSGTWEILMVRSRSIDTEALLLDERVTCELDSYQGYYNPGAQYLASGVLEWIRKLYWPDVAAPEAYALMKREAAAIPPGSEGVTMRCDLLGDAHAGWQGVTLSTRRGHFYRAAMEALAQRLKQHLTLLEKIGRFNTEVLTLVGGGSNNEVWNQIKADTIGHPVRILSEAETTVLGAAMFAWAGCGYYVNVEEARARVNFDYRVFIPQ
ncbi:L-fuculokinase [Paramixta manurensis]|uniref:L-fuculokinase n=1 Tax=Paramixta manurensis TaxID=2740817 RepID=A0A6M8U932_9GAMM|nr:L-fuculokinase [Erwiniaceae bacterium PD-1]